MLRRTGLHQAQARRLGDGGSSAASFGPDTLLTLANGSGIPRNILELVAAYTDNTNLTEDSSFTIRLLRGGAQADVAIFNGDIVAGTPALWLKSSNADYTVPVLRVESSGNNGAVIGLFIGGVKVGMIRADNSSNITLAAGGTQHSFYTGGDSGVGGTLRLQVDATTGLLPKGRVQPATASSTAVATTITLPTDGATFPLTAGTGTLNAINTTSWVSGAWGILVPASGVTITHNVAGAGGSVPILTPTGASIGPTATTRGFLFVYNGSNFIIVG